MSLAQLVPPALRPTLRTVRDHARRLTPTGRALFDWRALTRADGKYPPQSRFGGQEGIRPFIHECELNGEPTRLLIGTVEGRDWYTKDGLFSVELGLWTKLRLAQPGDVVFDLGANQGITAIALARMVGPRGKVFAFDPFPMNCDLIRLNCRLNGVRNVEVVEVGLGERSETVQVSAHQQCLAADSPLDSTSIRVEPLDTFADLRPRFVKMDIEGAEVGALSAAGKVFAHRPNLYLEVHRNYIPRFGRRPEELADYVPTSGYATAAVWTPPADFQPITAAALSDAPGNWGHIVLKRD